MALPFFFLKKRAAAAKEENQRKEKRWSHEEELGSIRRIYHLQALHPLEGMKNPQQYFPLSSFPLPVGKSPSLTHISKLRGVWRMPPPPVISHFVVYLWLGAGAALQRFLQSLCFPLVFHGSISLSGRRNGKKKKKSYRSSRPDPGEV